MTTATHQHNGQHWGSANGNHGAQKPTEVGTAVRSTMPDMVGAIGGDDACGRRRLPRVGQWLFFQDPSHRRYPQMQSCPAQCLGDLDLAHAGA